MELTGEYAQTYQIIEEIGAGSGGTVYRAYHKRLQKEVVLKKINDSAAADIANIRREVDILKNLRHSYLPQVLDFMELESGIYTVMDYIPGQSLESLMKAGYRFGEKEIVRLAQQMCEALAYLHSRRPAVIHGDIKPANIMITPEGNVCLIDFNISGISDGRHAYVNGFSKGYAAPEQYEAYRAYVQQRQSAQQMPPAERYDQGQQSGSWTPPAQGYDQGQQNWGWAPPAEQPPGAADMEGTEILQLEYGEDGTALLYPEEPPESDQTDILPADSAQGYEQEYGQEYAQGYEQEYAQGYEQVSSPGGNEPAMAEVSAAPSGFCGGIPVDTRSDVFSLAATLYHMLTGQKVTQQGEAALISGASDGLCMILNKALQTNPEKRYADAGKMLSAFQNIYKLDKRYKRVILRQQLAEAFFVLLAVAGIILAISGKNRIVQEKEDSYSEYVRELVTAREEGDEDSFEKYYEKAVSLFEDRMEPYYEKSLMLYENREYAEGIAYFENTVMSVSQLFETDEIASIFYLLGRDYFETEQYEYAANAYSTAIRHRSDESVYYVEHAISLARIGQFERAKESLRQATERNAPTDLLLLTKGEISAALGNTQEAEEFLMDCIDLTEDDYIKLRAYVTCCDSYGDYAAKRADAEGYRKQITLMNRAHTELPLQYQPMILERLAQAQIDCGKIDGNREFYLDAIRTLTQIAEAGWGSFTTYNNIAVLYEICGDYQSASEVLAGIEKDNKENYEYYKRLAFLELEIQQTKEMEAREYQTFRSYYETAMSLYEKRKEQNDPEMLRLRELYKQAEDGNWF